MISLQTVEGGAGLDGEHSPDANGYTNLPEEEDKQLTRSGRKKSQVNSALQMSAPTTNTMMILNEEKTFDHDDEEEDDEGSQHSGQAKHKDSYDYQTATMSSTVPEPKLDKKKSGEGKSSKIGHFSLKAHLPYLKINVPLTLSGSDIHEIFSLVSKSKSF